MAKPKDSELAAALLAGAKMEVAMFGHYNALIGKMDSLPRRRELAQIRLQEVGHLQTASDVLKQVVASPTVFDQAISPGAFAQSRIIIPHVKPSKVDGLSMEKAMKECYLLERDYEKVYSEVFSSVADPRMKMRLMNLVVESRAHAVIMARMLESMEIPVPGV